jgi:hypothetical protein
MINEDKDKWLSKNILMIFVLAANSVLFVMVFILFIYHTYLAFNNLTTCKLFLYLNK